MPKGTIRLHRVFRTNPQRVYRAFLDADAMAKWLPPYGFTCKVHHMDSKVGGTYKMSFTNFSTGHGHSFGGEYRELVPFETIRYTDSFDDPNLSGEMQTTVTLKEVSRSEEHTSELQSPCNLVCRLLLEKKQYVPIVIVLFSFSFDPTSQESLRFGAGLF